MKGKIEKAFGYQDENCTFPCASLRRRCHSTRPCSAFEWCRAATRRTIGCPGP